MSGSQGNSMINGQPALKSDLNILLFHQQGIGVLAFPHTYTHLLLSIFYITAILEGTKWYSIVISICIFLINFA